jgi:GTP pyrophosphokinase
LPIEFSGGDYTLLKDTFRLANQIMTTDADSLKENIYAWSDDYNPFNVGLEMANILAGLNLDAEAISAAMIYRLVREGRLSEDEITRHLNSEVYLLLSHVVSMSNIRLVSDGVKTTFTGQEVQSGIIRKMLVAMLDDVRIVLLKLSERCCALHVASEGEERSIDLAREAVQIYIPLAHRLGIGQLKWELEDCAFRFLDPERYKSIAKNISEKRLSRENYLHNAVDTLRSVLDEEGIQSEVLGRVKHIFSIWRKMQRKNISFEEVYDIRAIRILVPEVKDCYMVLGVVHNLWRNIPKEFDDYIAQPKKNGYRSLHTAVIGPDEKALEIQIRTFKMHEEAELGVCAHWKYKGMDAQINSVDSYEEKLSWFRQSIDAYINESDNVLHIFGDEVGEGGSISSIYTYTPKGHVVELPSGATPLDFAYRIHTEIGHGCRGAKVNGRIVPLTYELATGDKIEVIVEKNGEPNSEWLRGDLHYLKTGRASLKVRTWFRQRSREKNIVSGKAILEKEFKRLGLAGFEYKSLIEIFNYDNVDDFFVALAIGNLSIGSVLSKVQDTLNNNYSVEQHNLLPETKPKLGVSDAAINVQGVGNLLTTVAACCKPVPGDSIRGFVTKNRGVSIHRQDCSQLLELEMLDSKRVLNLNWEYKESDAATFAVDVLIDAYDRTGLIRDISTLLANEHINVISMNSLSRKNESVVQIRISIEVKLLERLSFIMARFRRLNNVIAVYRG